MQETYQKSSRSYHEGAQDVGSVMQAPETLPGILGDIEKIANELRAMTAQATDNLSGAIPEKAEKPLMGRGGSIISTALEIRSVLREATSNQQRVLNALAL